MLVDGGGPEAEDVVATLCAASPDPAGLVREFFTDEDRDFRQLALAMIAVRSAHAEAETAVDGRSERRYQADSRDAASGSPPLDGSNPGK
jgi:hypothetical protein